MYRIDGGSSNAATESDGTSLPLYLQYISSTFMASDIQSLHVFVPRAKQVVLVPGVDTDVCVPTSLNASFDTSSAVAC